MVVVLLAVTAVIGAADSAFSAAAQTLSRRQPDGHVDLLEVPQPELARVDPPVQEQIRAAQAALAATMAKPDATSAQRAEAFGTLGQIYQAYDFSDAALACYENASRLDAQSFRWPYYAGYLHQRNGDSDAAVRDYQRALTLKPDNTCGMLRLANMELTSNQVDLAKSWFMKAMAQRDHSAAAMTGLGKIALAEHQYREALKYFTQALAKEPKASSIHYQLAMAYRGLGDLPLMQEQLQARGDVEPTIQDPLLDEISVLKQGKVGLLERGATAMRENRFADAVATYRQMIRLDPSDPIAYKYLGVSLARSGKRDEALEQYAQALELDPNNATVHYNMGILLTETGKEEFAIPHFREALQLDPGLGAAHFQLANLLMRQGKPAEAGQEYGVVVSLEPQNGFARLMQAMAAVHAGAYKQARSLLEEATLALPRDPDIANALARLMAAAPDPAVRDERRGLRIIEALVQSQQGDGLEEGITLAMALAAVGRFQEAAGYQQAIIQQLEESRRADLARLLRQNLARYEQGKTCRMPWASNDPIFTPVPSKLQLQFPFETKTMAARP